MVKRPDLRPYQHASLTALAEGIRAGHQHQLLVAPTGAGKCLGRGTPVLMFDGSVKPVEAVVAGDRLMGPDSTPRVVRSTTAGRGPLYRVIPAKGDAYVVNDAHILSLKMTRGATKWNCLRSDIYQAGRIHNISVLEYLSSSKTFRHCAKGWRTGVEFQPSAALPIDPYFLGAWLGDGLSRGPAICSADSEILTMVEHVAAQHGLQVRLERQAGNRSVVAHITCGQRGGSNPVRAVLTDLGLLQNKHIPHAYLTASRADRLQLLAGLIDTDGARSRGGFDFVQKNERLAREVAFLARSLGLAAYVTAARKTCANNGVEGDYWRLSISGDCSVVPVRLARRVAPARAIKKDALLVGLSVEPIGEGEYFGFEIDGDRLFLLGDFTVTHNTVMAADLLARCLLKGSRATIVVDRVALVDQTSATLDRYGIDHGVQQAAHWRRRPHAHIQVASAQTLEKRGFFTGTDLLIVDEAHCIRQQTAQLIRSMPHLRVVGLTATPFTKGLGELYTNIVNVTTTDHLIEEGFLVPLKVYAAKAIDMTGAKVVAGEWAEREIEDRGNAIVGDVVAEWVAKTHLHFGGPAKTIVFSATVAHGEELCRQFAAAGFNFRLVSYKDDNDDARRNVVEEFRRPNSAIHGLVSCEALTKGFDVPDVLVGVACRPYRKSFSSHIQQLGRVMRPAPGKAFALWLDHCGNYMRFLGDQQSVFAHGVQGFEDGGLDSKPRPEPSEKAKETLACRACGFVFPPSARRSPTCPACGAERRRAERSTVESLPGQMVEVDGRGALKGMPDFLADRDAVWAQLTGLALDRKGGDREAAERWTRVQYKSLYGEWARRQFDPDMAVPPGDKLRRKVMQNIIAWAKAREAEQRRSEA